MQADTARNSAPNTDSPEAWVSTHAASLFRYARSRLRSEHEAHDVVQETLIAGWRSRKDIPDAPDPAAAWLKSVLRNKIADHYRKVYRERGTGENLSDLGLSADYENSGHWDDSRSPKNWVEPSEKDSRGRIELREALDHCIQKLPPTHARLFLMRESECIETPEILKITGLSESNLFVMLHRARLALRRCLEANHFSAQGLTR